MRRDSPNSSRFDSRTRAPGLPQPGVIKRDRVVPSTTVDAAYAARATAMTGVKEEAAAGKDKQAKLERIRPWPDAQQSLVVRRVVLALCVFWRVRSHSPAGGTTLGPAAQRERAFAAPRADRPARFFAPFEVTP